ncbi:MAG TPA: choice-of-anchor tandem repeat GloVer-containing protein [Terriglobales bacterium]
MKRNAKPGLLLTACTLCLLAAQATWAGPNFKVLHAFGNGEDGAGLWSPVTLDNDGNLCGATSGSGTHGQGVVFRLTPQSDGSWSEAILHNFPSSPDDGGDPNGALTQDASGNWYGTTKGGGYDDFGTIFKLRDSADGWTEFPIYKLRDYDYGSAPVAGLAMDKLSNLYGTATAIAFQIIPR